MSAPANPTDTPLLVDVADGIATVTLRRTGAGSVPGTT
jgi:hypothetical protein